MELENAITIALAIGALVVSVLAIVVSILFYRFQTQQAEKMAKDNADFAKEMHGLLGEIRVVTASTREQVQEQFTKMLDATLQRETTDLRAAVDSATDKGVRELHNRVEALEQLLPAGQGDTEAQTQLDALKQTVSSLSSAVDEAVIKATDAIHRERELEARLGAVTSGPVASYATPSRRASRFEKYTERARRVLMTFAQEEAQRFNHSYIGTEHILLGLVREEEGIAAKVLSNLGVELNKVRSAVEFIIGRGERIVSGEIGLTPRAKKAIELALDEARRLSHNYIGTEHLLLGLLREGEGVAAGVLESLGISLENARAETLKVMESG